MIFSILLDFFFLNLFIFTGILISIEDFPNFEVYFSTLIFVKLKDDESLNMSSIKNFGLGELFKTIYDASISNSSFAGKLAFICPNGFVFSWLLF